MLVSREYEEDSSALNDDGLTQEEREQTAEEKERTKIHRQVEADLGGFDVEQEWVEEVERDDCFRVESELGGAPPVPKTAYSLWIVDAANGWVVVDSHELEEFEHGLTMSVMHLSEVSLPTRINWCSRSPTYTHQLYSSWQNLVVASIPPRMTWIPRCSSQWVLDSLARMEKTLAPRAV
jgi:hypothetical protein